MLFYSLSCQLAKNLLFVSPSSKLTSLGLLAVGILSHVVVAPGLTLTVRLYTLETFLVQDWQLHQLILYPVTF